MPTLALGKTENVQITALVTPSPGGGFHSTVCELDTPGPHEVRVRIEAVGLCHTDIGVAAGYLPDVTFPVVLGHEGAGVVEEVGFGVTHVRVGDHVVLTGPRCQTCRFCADGRPAYCQRADELVFACRRADGTTALRSHVSLSDSSDDAGRASMPIGSHFFGQSSFATHAIAAAAGVVPIDVSIPFHLAAPLACGVVTGWGTVVNHLRVRAGDTVVVVGVGGVGSAAVAAAIERGATVVAIDPLAGKRAVAEAMGASVIDGGHNPDEVTGEVRELTNGGADHVVCTIGAIDVVEHALTLAGRNGTVALIGGSPPGSRLSVDPNDLLFAGKRLTGVRMGEMIAARDIPALVEHWQRGVLPLEQFVTTFALADIDNAIAATQRGDVIKAVLLPQPSPNPSPNSATTPNPSHPRA